MTELENLQRKDSFTDEDIQALIRLSGDGDRDVRYQVAELMVRCPAAAVEDALLEMLDDPEELVRTNACDSLCISKNPIVIKRLMEVMTKDGDSLTRSYAALSIGDTAMGTSLQEHAAAFLARRLDRERIKHVKIAIMRSMYLLGDRSRYRELLLEIKGKRYLTRCFAIGCVEDIVNAVNKAEIKTALEKSRLTEKSRACTEKIDDVLTRLNK